MKTAACQSLFLSLFVLTLGFNHPAYGDVSLHPLFSDGTVLQRDAPVTVWGWADAGEAITVEIQDQARSTQAQNGEWEVVFNDLETGGPYQLKVSGENELTVENVMVGEVWVCSGQSNMEWHVAWADNPEAEIANANFPNIRFFKVPKRSTSTPQNTLKAAWQVCSPETVHDFSAVGYYFGRTLRQNLDVPIGLIMSAWGGTPAESWTSHEALASDEELQVLLDNYQQDLQTYQKNLQNFSQDLLEWVNQARQYLQDPTQNLPSPPQAPSDNRLRGWRVSGLYNAMIAPLIPYRIQGVIWYQGESNAKRAYQYRKLFSTMIQDWRENWAIGNFSFYWVQLANYIPGNDAKNTWPELREAQNMALQLPNTGHAVSIDIGNPHDIHPKNKQEVGRRLALDALAKDYGRELVDSGPMYRRMEKEENRLRIHFDHADGGLVFKGAASLQGFTIAGNDQHFVPAEAKIDGDTVVVSSSKISNPVAVRYAWKDNPEEANLYNHAQLPASPFRTDDWPAITKNNQ